MLLGQSWDFEMAVSPVLGECMSEHCASPAHCAGAAWLSSCDPRARDSCCPRLASRALGCRRDRAAVTQSEMIFNVSGTAGSSQGISEQPSLHRMVPVLGRVAPGAAALLHSAGAVPGQSAALWQRTSALVLQSY